MEAIVSQIAERQWRKCTAKQGDMPPAVLIADPDVSRESSLAKRLVQEGMDVCFAATLSEIRALTARHRLDYALTEVSFPDGDAISVIKTVQSTAPHCRTIVHSRSCDLKLAVQATKAAGASDVLPKPMETDFLLSILLDRSVRHGDAHGFPGNPFQLRLAYILDVYSRCGLNASRAARELSMHRRTLQRFLKRSRPLISPPSK